MVGPSEPTGDPTTHRLGSQPGIGAPAPATLDMSPAVFRTLGHALVDRIAGFMAELPAMPLTSGETPGQIRAALGDSPLPEDGSDPTALLDEAFTLLRDHSLFNGHPRFWGYITSSAAPIGLLGELLAAAINPNVGAFGLAPMATEIEAQSVRWIAELLGYPTDCGGLFTSGGNMANIIGFLAARHAHAPEIRSAGVSRIGETAGRLRAYASAETHTWLEKAADIAGLGTDSTRWIPTDAEQRMDLAALEAALTADRAAGDRPFLVIGAAGTVSTGAVDPLPALAELCRRHGLWFHVDGAYGGFAAAVPGTPPDLQGLSLADSVAVDPHKWLFAPIDAGCALVRDREALRGAFSYHPPYYGFDHEAEAPINYYEYGIENSRGFRALKVWLALRQAGRSGYVAHIRRTITLAEELHAHIAAHPELEARTLGLSIVTFRYAPASLRADPTAHAAELNRLNNALLDRIQSSGEAFVSNAVIDGDVLLRVCIVNLRTTSADVAALPEIVARLGAEVSCKS